MSLAAICLAHFSRRYGPLTSFIFSFGFSTEVGERKSSNLASYYRYDVFYALNNKITLLLLFKKNVYWPSFHVFPSILICPGKKNYRHCEFSLVSFLVGNFQTFRKRSVFPTAISSSGTVTHNAHTRTHLHCGPEIEVFAIKNSNGACLGTPQLFSCGCLLASHSQIAFSFL